MKKDWLERIENKYLQDLAAWCGLLFILISFLLLLCTPFTLCFVWIEIAAHKVSTGDAIYAIISILNIPLGPAFSFFLWKGYWPFYTKWKNSKVKFYDESNDELIWKPKQK